MFPASRTAIGWPLVMLVTLGGLGVSVEEGGLKSIGQSQDE